MPVRVSRRQFLQGAGSAALVASAHVLAGIPRRARAALPANPIVVLIQLEGGNDALNTVIPVNNGGIAQRSLYDFYRPDLRIAANQLSATQIGVDPVVGNTLAFHPVMTDFKTLFDAGHLAVVNGVGFPGAPLSHARAKEVWFAGDPAGFTDTGWLGRVTDATVLAADTPSLALGPRTIPMFAGVNANALAARTLDGFALPDDPLFPDVAPRRTAWSTIFAASAGDSPFLARIRRQAFEVIAQEPAIGAIELAGWGSQLEAEPTPLHADLHQIVSLLRHDAMFPDDASGISLFHVTQPGYDTHTQQGADEPEGLHAQRLAQLGDALAKYSADLVALGQENSVLTLTYSELGRRPRQSGNGESAGTDHGTTGTMFVLGGAVVGGVYGASPGLDSLDAEGNPAFTVDFRRVYATVIDRFLGADHNDFLAGAPFVPLEFLAPA
jgi:uncharacterized protein (DUF1501 family)